MKFGCCTTYKNYKTVERIGYDYIELNGYSLASASEKEFMSFQQEAKEGKLPCLAVNAYCGDNLAMSGPLFDLKAAKAYAELLCARAKAVGVKSIGLGAPLARKMSPGYDRKQAEQEVIQFIQATAEIAMKYNMLLLIEAVNQCMCDFACTTKEALSIVQKLDMPNLFLVLDFYHMQVMQEDLMDIGHLMPYVKHLHISGNGPNHERYYMGMEDLDFLRKLVARIQGFGYNGTFSMEADTEEKDFYANAMKTWEVFQLLKGEGQSQLSDEHNG